MKSNAIGYIGYIRLANGKKLYITSIELGDYNPWKTPEKQPSYLLGNIAGGRARRLKLHLETDNRVYVVVDGQKYYEEQWVNTVDWDGVFIHRKERLFDLNKKTGVKTPD